MPDTDIPDLWPADIAPEKLRTPVSILRAQAAALGKRTRNIIEAEVRSGPFNGRFLHEFFIVVPTFGGYRFKLLSISHDIHLYPVRVMSGPRSNDVLANEQEFLSWLKEAFATDGTQRVLSALLAQATEGVPAA